MSDLECKKCGTGTAEPEAAKVTEAPGDEYRLTEAGKARADAEAPRYALVEQENDQMLAKGAAVAAQEPHAAREADAYRLAAILADRQVLVIVGDHAEPHTLARPYDLAVRLLTAVDPRLTDDAPQPAPELAAYEADIASLTGQRNRVSETADQLRAIVAEVLAAVELGTLGQHTPKATSATLARTAEWRERARLT
jgi:hypothetical protein